MVDLMGIETCSLLCLAVAATGNTDSSSDTQRTQPKQNKITPGFRASVSWQPVVADRSLKRGVYVGRGLLQGAPWRLARHCGKSRETKTHTQHTTSRVATPKTPLAGERGHGLMEFNTI